MCEKRELGLEARFEQLTELTTALGHDLRGLLQMVSGYADLLAADGAGTLTEKQSQYVQFIRTGAEDLLHLIEQYQERRRDLVGSAKSCPKQRASGGVTGASL
jgi:signal transduction histidine kinase